MPKSASLYLPTLMAQYGICNIYYATGNKCLLTYILSLLYRVRMLFSRVAGLRYIKAPRTIILS